VKLLIQEASEKTEAKADAKVCKDEVEDLLYIQKKIQEENEKLPYWQFVLNLEVEVEGDGQGDQGPETSEGRFERLMIKYRSELIDAAGPLALPPRVSIAEKEEAMLENSPKKASRFASLGFLSPTKRKVLDDGGNSSSPQYGDIYGHQNDDDPFSFTFNRKDLTKPSHAHFGLHSANAVSPYSPPAPQSRTAEHVFRFGTYANGSPNEENAAAASMTMDEVHRSSPNLANDSFYFTNHMRVGTKPTPHGENKAKVSPRSPSFFANDFNLENTLSQEQKGDSGNEWFATDMHASPPQRQQSPQHSPSSADAAHNPRSERWTSMLDRARRRTTKAEPGPGPGPGPDYVQETVFTKMMPTASAAKEALSEADGSVKSSSSSSVSVDVPNLPLPYLVRSKTKTATSSASTPLVPINLRSRPSPAGSVMTHDDDAQTEKKSDIAPGLGISRTNSLVSVPTVVGREPLPAIQTTRSTADRQRLATFLSANSGLGTALDNILAAAEDAPQLYLSHSSSASSLDDHSDLDFEAPVRRPSNAHSIASPRDPVAHAVGGSPPRRAPSPTNTITTQFTEKSARSHTSSKSAFNSPNKFSVFSLQIPPPSPGQSKGSHEPYNVVAEAKQEAIAEHKSAAGITPVPLLQQTASTSSRASLLSPSASAFARSTPAVRTSSFLSRTGSMSSTTAAGYTQSAAVGSPINSALDMGNVARLSQRYENANATNPLLQRKASAQRVTGPGARPMSVSRHGSAENMNAFAADPIVGSEGSRQTQQLARAGITRPTALGAGARNNAAHSPSAGSGPGFRRIGSDISAQPKYTADL